MAKTERGTEIAGERERALQDDESRVMELIAQHPSDPAPYVALTELFEKCDVTRSRRVVDAILIRQRDARKEGAVRRRSEELRVPAGNTGVAP